MINSFIKMVSSWLVWGILILMPVACSSYDTSWQYCGFEFDLRYDHQDAYVINYKLWSDRYTLVAPDKYYVDKGTKFYVEGVGGMVDRPHYLYVKWHDNPSNHDYEATINLKPTLPKNLDGGKIYFLLRGDRIEVYLAVNEKRPKDYPMLGAGIYGGQINILLNTTQGK